MRLVLLDQENSPKGPFLVSLPFPRFDFPPGFGLACTIADQIGRVYSLIVRIDRDALPEHGVFESGES